MCTLERKLSVIDSLKVIILRLRWVYVVVRVGGGLLILVLLLIVVSFSCAAIIDWLSVLRLHIV